MEIAVLPTLVLLGLGLLALWLFARPISDAAGRSAASMQQLTAHLQQLRRRLDRQPALARHLQAVLVDEDCAFLGDLLMRGVDPAWSLSNFDQNS